MSNPLTYDDCIKLRDVKDDIEQAELADNEPDTIRALVRALALLNTIVRKIALS